MIMKHSSAIVVAIFVAFFIFITLRGELSDYLNILRGVKSGDADSEGESGGLLGGAIGESGGGFLESLGIKIRRTDLPKTPVIVDGILKEGDIITVPTLDSVILDGLNDGQSQAQIDDIITIYQTVKDKTGVSPSYDDIISTRPNLTGGL